MSTVESRVREALYEDVDRRSADDILDGVRRGARRRRRRGRAAAGAMVTAVVVTAAAGTTIHRGSGLDFAGSPEAPAYEVGATDVSVTASGQLFKVVSNEGCQQPCSTIWRQDDGSWTRLAEFHGTSADASVAIVHVEMAPDGRDGWAWGNAFWSTHDGGDTWTKVTAIPYYPYGLDVQVGATEAWATAPRPTGGDDLWHTPIGTDDWTQVEAPRVLDFKTQTMMVSRRWTMLDVLADGRVALQDGTTRSIGMPVMVGGEYGWQKEPVPCRKTGPLLAGQLPNTTICGPVGRTLNWGTETDAYSQFQVGLHPLSPTDSVGEPDMLYVSADQASISTPSGAVASDLRLGADHSVVGWSEAGERVAIVTGGHRVFLSDDNGRHWHQD
ncbi:MAG TPA: hypothetical protein VH085_11560 [Nocardioides sp.]|nr:hypothetical protein [Nocardioides sp.]